MDLSPQKCTKWSFATCGKCSDKMHFNSNNDPSLNVWAALVPSRNQTLTECQQDRLVSSWTARRILRLTAGEIFWGFTTWLFSSHNPQNLIRNTLSCCIQPWQWWCAAMPCLCSSTILPCLKTESLLTVWIQKMTWKPDFYADSAF